MVDVFYCLYGLFDVGEWRFGVVCFGVCADCLCWIYMVVSFTFGWLLLVALILLVCFVS